MEGMSDLNALNLEPGEVVGGYTLISRLDSGAMGSVWRVRDGGGTTYAMKILRDSLADESVAGSGSASAALHDPDLKPDVTPRERLRREAMALKKVNHPGVCGIVDMELDDTLAFIVTELIEGKNLKDDVAANGRYVGDDLERLARKLIDATKAVHAAGIVHRDIKPTNVMVSAAGPVLVDFGIAMGEGESHVTRTGLVMGTPGFIAPEIIDGAESDDATDWWSVASVLAFAATGAPVFGTKPMMAVLEREASGNANLSGLPAGTLAAFRSALDPDRTKRCTPDQLLNAIALDALTPAVWQGAQAGPFAAGAIAGGANTIEPVAGTAGETEAMPPFGAADHVDRNNPRTIWRATDEAAQALTDEATTTLPDSAAPAISDEATVQLAGATVPLTEATTPLTSEATTPLTPVTGEPLLAPTEALVQQPLAPNPADVKRGEYLQRGVFPLLLLALPLAVLAASMPLIALLAAEAMLWLLLTLAYNTEPQLEREGRRGGERKSSDTWIRAATLPWHIVKALLLSLPRMVLLIVIAIAGTAAATMALALPTQTVYWYFTPERGVPIPLLNDVPLSASGLALGGFMAIGWLVTVFGPQAMMARLGAGVLRGLNPRQAQSPMPLAYTGSPAVPSPAAMAPAPATRGKRSTMLFTIWIIVTLALCTLPLTGMAIDWTPLV
ncbi:protein kinase [Bifidobacterium longum subsp. infantis]|uniref:non-specific serine/threonine protein kinase n=1 Tax=Bifidobacterium longum subsp. infantis TaxID=1682 RepID=A0AAX1LLP4_BIFLI|nr:serine/threonine-protein kinase [Bifidobacterium longum]QSP97998.1 protein kinase [Bifidobacterium longum subsp. infantis]QSZ18244.1 protein kinase [Bifidobacterium longum subsp. infantis]QTB92303.1 protein kinase [Bifidobacterium longum subsp. infantis]